MKRKVFEIAMIVFTVALGLEVIHYRNAVLEANVDRKRAWKTVVELRESYQKCVANAGHTANGPEHP